MKVQSLTENFVDPITDATRPKNFDKDEKSERLIKLSREKAEHRAGKSWDQWQSKPAETMLRIGKSNTSVEYMHVK